MNDDELLDALGDALRAPDREVPEDRLAALRAQVAAGAGTGGAAESQEPVDRRRRTVLVGTVAAALGAAAGIAGARALDEPAKDDAAPTRPVDFGEAREGTTVAGRTIDHTWGMELLLDVAGLPAGRDYAVAYETAAGPVSAGGFRSVDVEMHCRFNATALRDQVTEVTVTDTSTAEIVLRGRPA